MKPTFGPSLSPLAGAVHYGTVAPIFIVHLSEAEHHLGDDVVLDLVRAAIDRGLAHVGVGGRREVGIVRPDRKLVVAVPGEAAEVGRAIDADRLQRQLGDPLLDLGALDLEDRAFRTGALALALARERAEFGVLKS